MPKLKLTKATIDALPHAEKGQTLYFDTQMPGFGLCVGRKTKTYFAQREVGSRTVRVTIGRHGIFTAEQARIDARETLVRLSRGEDVNQTKRANEARIVTLGEALEAYLNSRKALRPFTLQTYRRVVASHLGEWKDRPLSALTPPIVLKLHADLGETIGRPSANTTMRILRAIYNFASVVNDGLPINPVSHLTRSRAWYREIRRQTVIQLHQLPAWFKAVSDLPNATSRDYLLLLLFTGMRRSEALRLRWEHVDLRARTISLPDTKNHETLVLPLSRFLAELFERRMRDCGDSPWVFPGTGTTGHLKEPKKFIAKVRETSGVEFTLHDLRRTFITIAESLDIPAYALKRLLNHKDRHDVTAGYIVLNVERLRAPMEKVSERIIQLTTTSANNAISPIQLRRINAEVNEDAP